MSRKNIRLTDIDPWFSKIIKDRDNYTCVLCGAHELPPTKRIQCSHYWGKDQSLATRYCELNCDALCGKCHLAVENNKQGEYRDFKIRQLGQEKYNELDRKRKSTCKMSTRDKQELLEQLKEKCKHLKYI